MSFLGRLMCAACSRLTAREWPRYSMYTISQNTVAVRLPSRPYFIAWNPQETMEVLTLDQHGATRYDWSSDALRSPQVRRQQTS